MTLAGPKAWTVEEVIALCEKYADAEADVSPPDCCCSFDVMVLQQCGCSLLSHVCHICSYNLPVAYPYSCSWSFGEQYVSCTRSDVQEGESCLFPSNIVACHMVWYYTL